MASNFGSNFLRGFQPNFANMFNDSYRNAFISDEQERRRKEEEKAKQEQLGILSQLFRGTKDVPSFQNNRVPLMNAGQSFGNQEVPLSKQEQFDLRAKLSPSSALSFLDGQNKQDEYLAPSLSKDSPTILQWNKSKRKLEDTGQPNPLYKEQLVEGSEFMPAETVKGLERWRGYTVEQKVWTDKDGNVVKRGSFGNPTKPTYSTSGDGKKSYDLNAYKEKLGVYSKRESDLKTKIDKYKNDNVDTTTIGSYGNAINKAYDKEEIALYNDLLPEAKRYVNENFYQPLKESGSPEEVAYSDREGIFQDYTSDLMDDYKKGKIQVDLNNYTIPAGVDPEEYKKDVEAEVFRSALLWGKLKFRRL